MSTNFSSLRSSRSSLLKKLADEAKKESAKGGAVDDRFWKHTYDAKTKIGYSVIRFLPAVKGEDIPWVRLFSHGFKGPSGAWFIENCPTTIGRECPVCKENNRLWATEDKGNQNIARDRKRKLTFISNILVVTDTGKADNNGKTFLFKYGQKIHDKLKEVMNPEFPDQEAFNPFDLWEGANFKLKSQDQGGFVNYDKSSFENPSALLGGDDAALETLWGQERPLVEFGAESAFRSYDDLEKKMIGVLSGTIKPRTAEEAIKAAEGATPETAAEVAREVAAAEDKPKRSRKATAKPTPEPEAEAGEDDEDIKNFFKNLES